MKNKKDKYTIMAWLIFILYVWYVLAVSQDDTGFGYYALLPFLLTGFLYLPFGMGKRKENKLSQTSLNISVFIFLLLLLTFILGWVYGLLGKEPYMLFSFLSYWIVIVGSIFATVLQIGALARKK